MLSTSSCMKEKSYLHLTVVSGFFTTRLVLLWCYHLVQWLTIEAHQQQLVDSGLGLGVFSHLLNCSFQNGAHKNNGLGG